MGRLDAVGGPRDLDGLSQEQLAELADEVREFLVDRVARTGGHLGPNLGVVELTIALHRVFDSPRDLILFDTGHQAYVHKMLTGRRAGFDTLRQTGGLSGYPSRAESEHDVIENSHASTALAYADGIAKAWSLGGVLADGSSGANPGAGSGDRHVVAVVGDGALTGGMAWEALNNIAGSDRQVIIVVNDNERSYAPTTGGLAQHLATLRTTASYERTLRWGKRMLLRTPYVGQPGYHALHGMKKGVKDMLAPQGLFEDLGLKYIGPVDGHDVEALEFALRRASTFAGPVIVHALTEKGRGYKPAEQDEADRFHGVGVIDPETGRPVSAGAPSWTSVFGDELVQIGRRDPSVVALTAAMLAPTGLDAFADAFPERTFDSGIAEQHAATSAAGMAFAGLHPVVAVYSTFINRAFDQVLMDCALHKAGVTFVLDRAGVTGPDGASHHGVWDLSLLGIVPGLRMAAPRDGRRLRELLNVAVGIDDGPTVVRFPSGPVPPDLDAQRSVGEVDVLGRFGTLPTAGGRVVGGSADAGSADAESVTGDVLLVAVGATAPLCLEAARLVAGDGPAGDGPAGDRVGVTVVDPGWVSPIPDELVVLARSARAVVTVEDGITTSGVGSRVSARLREEGIDVPVRDVGLPARFLAHGKRSDVQSAAGLTADHVAEVIQAVVADRGVG